MEKEVTSQQQQDYKINPNACPFCGSTDITGGHFEAEDDRVYREVECNDCKLTWTERFLLDEISEAHTNN